MSLSWRHRLGTRWRMTLWVLLIVFVVTAVAGIIAIKIVEHRFTSDIDESLRETSLGAKAAFTILSDEQIEEFAEDSELRSISDRDRALMILSADGIDVSVESGSLEDPDPLPDVTSIGFNQLRSRAEEIFELQGEGGGPTYRVLVSQLDDGRLLVVAAPLTPLDDALHTVGRVLLLVAIGGSIVMAVIVTLVTGYVTRPLDGMITTAQGIGSGDLDTRIPVRGVDDVAKLSSALNAMLDRLERAFADKEASEEKLRQFVADASHELRTPLSAVLGYAQLVQTGMASTPDQVDHAVGRIAAEGERMRMIVEELLMLARLDHGRAANPTRIDLADIAQVAVDDARAIAPDGPVAMHRGEVEPAVLDVFADAPTVRQAIDNLLANARAHTPEGTHVEVTVERRGRDVAVVVDDDGPGIDPADAAHLFDRFFRSERSRARPGGSGLGLSIVAAVAAAHDGSVTADRSPTGGARFTLTLPAADQTSCASTTDHSARVR